MDGAQQVPAGRGTLLVVDDERYSRETLQRLLRRQGYEVHAVGDGESALELVPSLQPELILLDVGMPGMDGYEVCRKLKADRLGQEIPVIFIGTDERSVKRKVFSSGGVDYICRPFVSGEVIARVGTQLSLYRLQRRREEQIALRTDALAAAHERLQREMADRREANERFRGVLESAPDAIVLVDARRRIVLVNSRTEILFGYGREELLGQPLQTLMPVRFHDADLGTTENCLPAPRSRSKYDDLVLFGRHKDGSEFPIEISLSPLRPAEQGYVVGAIRDVSGRVQAEKALRELAAHSDAVREEERKRIAGDIHDELGSLLTGLKMEISLLRMELGENTAAHQRLAQMRQLVESTLGMVRQVATQLRPSALNLGLVPALEWLLEDFERRSGIACCLKTDAEVAMDDVQATAVFRIIQESLTNVARHARASRVEVVLKHTGKGLDLTVIDNGCGFDTDGVPGTSFGLMSIRERALALGGRVLIASDRSRGTRVNIWIPVEEDGR